MVKIAFFDIDGTLVSFKTHEIPASTRRALERLRSRGVRTVLATGRPVYQIPARFSEGFDAYVTMNGQLCFDDRGVYRSVPLDAGDVRTVVERVRRGAFDVLVLQRESAFAYRLTDRVREVARNAGLEYAAGDIERALGAPVYQMCAFVDPGREDEVLEGTRHLATTRWTNLFCDVVPREGGKDFGVRATLERYGLDASEAVAFGDGENDVSMFGAVGTSVAMGNAWDSVKERASLVTASVDDDGIWKACEGLGLLG